LPRSLRQRRWLFGLAIGASYIFCETQALAQPTDTVDAGAPESDAGPAPEESDAGAPDAEPPMPPAPVPSPLPEPPPAEPPPPEPPPAADPEAFGAAAKVDPPAREVTTRSMKAAELTRMPGTRGDPIRAIEYFPGVGRAQLGGGLPSIRGAGINDSQVYLEGLGVPLLYHFGSITSFINGRLLDRVDFYPGNFSARYGRKMGGVIDVRLREPQTDKLHGVADLNLIDASVVAEGPVGKDASVAAAARRSHVDAYLKAVLPDNDDVSISAAPVYFDYQALTHIRVGERGRLRIMAFGSRDTFEVVIKKPSSEDPLFRGGVDNLSEFHKGQIGLRTDLTDSLEQNVEISVGATQLKNTVGRIFNLDLSSLDIYGRAEWKLRVAPALRLIGGFDHQTEIGRVSYLGLAPRSNFEDTTGGSPSTEQQASLARVTLPKHEPATYLEAQIRPAEPLLIVPSVRADYFSHFDAVTVDPRLAVRLDVAKDTTLKGGIGKFSQAPEIFYALDGFGNRNLKPSYAMHASAGVEQRFDDGAAMVSAEGFYKSLHDLLADTPGGRQPLFENAGSGRVFGMEIFARVMPKGRFFGLLSYTLARSERSAYGGPYSLYDLDQTHNFVGSGVYRLGRGWEVGASFRLVSGNPLTPVLRSTYDANVDLYRPAYGAKNSDRAPFFHRLDVRIEKKWTFEAWKLATYLDVQNAYNAQNQEGFNYNYDYTARKVFYGLPIIPSLGVRGEL
jgi:hypothetical protein